MWYVLILLIFIILFIFNFLNKQKDLVVVEMNVKTTNSNHNVMSIVNFHLVLVMTLVVNKFFIFEFFNKNKIKF